MKFSFHKQTIWLYLAYAIVKILHNEQESYTILGEAFWIFKKKYDMLGFLFSIISIFQLILIMSIWGATKQLIVPNKKCRLAMQMTNDRTVYILTLVNKNVYWTIICHLYCMTSFFYEAL